MTWTADDTRHAAALVAENDARVPEQRVGDDGRMKFEEGQRVYVKPPDGTPYTVIVDKVEPAEDGSGVTVTVHPAERGQTTTSEDLLYRPENA